MPRPLVPTRVQRGGWHKGDPPSHFDLSTTTMQKRDGHNAEACGVRDSSCRVRWAKQAIDIELHFCRHEPQSRPVQREMEVAPSSSLRHAMSESFGPKTLLTHKG